MPPGRRGNGDVELNLIRLGDGEQASEGAGRVTGGEGCAVIPNGVVGGGGGMMTGKTQAGKPAVLLSCVWATFFIQPPTLGSVFLKAVFTPALVRSGMGPQWGPPVQREAKPEL